MRHITLYKAINLIKIVLSYLLSTIIKKPLIWGLPLSISIEPTNSCNLNCPQCPSGNGNLTRRKELIKEEVFAKIINEVDKHLLYLSFYFQGEPFLHPKYTTLISKAKLHGIYTGSSTNGQLINPELAEKIVLSGLDRLIISVDGSTQEVYEKYRIGGKLTKAIESVEFIQEYKLKLKKSKPKLEMQFIVLKHNEHQIPDIIALSEKLGVEKLSLKTAQLDKTEEAKKMLPKQTKYARYTLNIDGSLRRKKAVRNRCWRAFSGAVIATNGDVLACSYDKNGEHVFGNINNESLAKIWKNKKATEFRKQLLLNRSQFDMCCNCTE